jgi:hypothetical protein
VSLEDMLPLKRQFFQLLWKNFANSLDKNDKSLWNKTDGSPKIKLFKEHFGDEFNIKSVELKELLGGLTRLVYYF